MGSAELAINEQPITLKTLGVLINTPTVPKRYRESPTGVADMMSVILTGRDVGIPDMMALQHIYLVNGQASMSGQLMCALVNRSGHRIKVSWQKDGTAVAEAWRRDPWSKELEMVGLISFGPEDADIAGLSDKDTYKSYPRVMRAWRAISQLCRIYFADCLMGIAYVPEEVEASDEIEPLPVSSLDVEMPDDVEIENGLAHIDDIIEAEVIDE